MSEIHTPAAVGFIGSPADPAATASASPSLTIPAASLAKIEEWARDHFEGALQGLDDEGHALARKALDSLKGAAGEAGVDARNVEAWFVHFFHNSAVSTNTAAFNALHAAKQKLLDVVISVVPAVVP
ncbi:MAG TPA: hypothetical protein VN667_17915 [Burkholderiales bacterium]|nr:hypothetical protein [Burkholderiales bacterium]